MVGSYRLLPSHLEEESGPSFDFLFQVVTDDVRRESILTHRSTNRFFIRLTFTFFFPDEEILGLTLIRWAAVRIRL